MGVDGYYKSFGCILTDHTKTVEKLQSAQKAWQPLIAYTPQPSISHTTHPITPHYTILLKMICCRNASLSSSRRPALLCQASKGFGPATPKRKAGKAGGQAHTKTPQQVRVLPPLLCCRQHATPNLRNTSAVVCAGSRSCAS